MEGVFEELPNHLHADHIRIHRIAKNGVEALVDERHVLLVGDASFLARYGLQFEEHPSASKGSVTLYISVDGLQSARISVRYTVLPTFEMLAHRLAKEGIRCVVETYDPMINSAMVARLREPTAPPVSVFHKNASDFNRSGGVVHPSEPVTIVAGASRLKLAESVVWCCRIHRLLSVFSGVSVACIVLAILTFATLTTLFGADVVFPLSVGSVNQLYAILVLVLTLVSDLLIAKLLLPQKRYFVTEEYERERERKREQEQQQRERQTARLAKKEKKTAPDPKNQEESKTS